MTLRLIPAAALAVLLVAIPVAAVEYSVPLLTVSDDTSVGSCVRIPFELETSGSERPLRILVSDDTPAGSGDSIRACAWLAAITAAMQCNDPMTGVEIKLEFSGLIDGPSAGSMLCLAILSARDGRTLPPDFAMTGLIMPDGTIGPVGGVAEKMKAAATAGIKRICIPAFLRFEYQPDDTCVDLFRCGKELGIEVVPVENITEAYAVMHGLPVAAAPELDARTVCALDSQTENALISLYLRYREKVDSYAGKPQSKYFDLGDRPDSDYAEECFCSGRLLTAVLAVTKIELFHRANSGADDFFKDFCGDGHSSLLDKGRLPTDSFRKDIAAFRGAVKKYHADITDPNLTFEYMPDKKWMSPISAQLESVGSEAWLRSVICVIDARVPEDCDLPKIEAEELRRILENDFLKLTFAVADKKLESIGGEVRCSIASVTPQIKPNNRAAEVENLFHSAWLAVDKSAETDILRQVAEDEDMSYGDLIDKLMAEDLHFATYHFNCLEAGGLHAQLEDAKSLKAPEYHTAVSMHAQINALAGACAMTIQYGPEAELSYDEDNYIESSVNSDFIHCQIRSARAQALRGIAECRKLNIPCPSPICDFEQAELNRDRSDKDKLHQVLVLYWRAGLNAKALVMAFGPTTHSK
ncbi:MAG: S16 family serine protease [Victivallaceae bacterium]|nr:S16 family serine protease [Victivallaceae bacterium]